MGKMKLNAEMRAVVSTTLEGLLDMLSTSEDIPSSLRVSVTDVRHFYRGGMKRLIIRVFLPIVFSLRERIRSGNPQYFASEQFVSSVSALVREECEKLAHRAKILRSAVREAVETVTPLLEAAREAANQYINGNRSLFEDVLIRMARILSVVERSMGATPTEEQYSVDICSVTE